MIDRFIKVPVEIFVTATVELIGQKNTPGETVLERLDVNKISSYRPDSIDEDDILDRTAVEMDNGVVHVVSMRIEEFEKLLNTFTRKR